MKSKVFLSTLIITAAMLASTQSIANDVYKWVGQDGVTHFGATPPKGVIAEKIASRNGKRKPSSSPAIEDKTLTQTQLALKSKRDEQCTAERKRLSTLEKSGARIRMNTADGTSRYLSPEEVEKEITNSKSFMKDVCS